ncbi:MAG: calcium/sodium antiporter [Lachnospiraceae bacterium]|nr:calcium/sodium antiporter [Lachnospiraceae bacterium]
MIALFILLLIVGFVALIKGADLFVDGSAALAKNLKVPSLIIGLTIVAMGTSAPELAVSTSAAIAGANEIALSNVIGSNMFNLLVVLGACALFHPVPVDKIVLKRDFPISIIVTVFIFAVVGVKALFGGKVIGAAMSEVAGKVYRWTGIVLLLCFIAYIVYLIMDAKRHPEPETEGERKPYWKCFLFIILGIALIVGGGQAVVRSAEYIAKAAGMTETLIGLTIVAVGTSLPELVTSVVAARKGETGLAIGNVVGSNIFNLMLILGISSAIHPVEANVASVFDLGILIIVSLIVLLFSVSKKKILRWEGIIMILVYVADVIFAIFRK